jgi:hypothetical protein
VAEADAFPVYCTLTISPAQMGVFAVNVDVGLGITITSTMSVAVCPQASVTVT